MTKTFAIALVFAPVFSTGAGPQTQLTDDQLAHIEFVQKLGATVPSSLAFADETGKTGKLADYFGGKPSVLMLGYYDCPMLCTLVLNGAADCFRNMNWKAGREFNVIFVSIDARERPALAAQKKQSYVRSYGAAWAGNWHFLTGDQNAISSLADSVGFHYQYDPGIKQFAHPSGLVILSADGKVARYFFGIKFAAAEVDTVLRDAAVNKITPAEPGFTLLCFHAAPFHGKYGKLVLVLVRTGAIAILAVLVGILVLSPGGHKREKTQ